MSVLPTVSAIIPTYNRAGLLGRAIRSVLAQTFQDWELLVVDDASEDHTKQVVLDFQDPRIRYLLRDTNGGGGAARNTGIRAARGQYLAYLDSDNEMLPKRLEEQLQVFKNSRLTELGVVTCGILLVDLEPPKVNLPLVRGKVFDDLLKLRAGVWDTNCIMVKHTPGSPEILWDETLTAGMDRDYLLRFTRRYQLDFTGQVLVHKYLAHGYERIGSEPRNVLRGRLEHLEKYRVDLQAHPRTLRFLHLHVARIYLNLKDMHGVRRHTVLAVLAHPRGLRTYVWLLGALLGPWSYRLAVKLFPSLKFSP